MAFHLVDDGTMDTVVACGDCGHEERFMYDPPDWVEDEQDPEAYDEFVIQCCEEAEVDHECEADPESDPTADPDDQ